MKLKEIRIDVIKPNPRQPRKSFRKIDELAENIEKNGLINPISVQPNKGGKFTIISGERRWKAFKFLVARRPVTGKYLKIPAIVKIPNLYEMIAENLARDEMCLIEKIDAVSKVLEKEFGSDYKKIVTRAHNGYVGEKEKKLIASCSAMGMKIFSVNVALPVLNLSSGVKKMILKNRDYFTDGVVMKLASIKDENIYWAITKSIVRERMNSKESFKAIRMGWSEFKGFDKKQVAWADFLTRWGKNYYGTLSAVKEIGSTENLRDAPPEYRKKLRTQLKELDLAIMEVLY